MKNVKESFKQLCLQDWRRRTLLGNLEPDLGYWIIWIISALNFEISCIKYFHALLR
jgi:hypothetical protein